MLSETEHFRDFWSDKYSYHDNDDSSLPPERISMSPHQMMKMIAQSPPTRTISEIATRMISLAVYAALESSTLLAADTVGIKEISIR